jgi:PAS domain S-box-containing protein
MSASGDDPEASPSRAPHPEAGGTRRSGEPPPGDSIPGTGGAPQAGDPGPGDSAPGTTDAGPPDGGGTDPGGAHAEEPRPNEPRADEPHPEEPRSGTLLDTLRVAVVMLDTTGRVLLWSPLAEEVLGWAGEHIVGRRVGGLFGPPGTSDGPVPGTAQQILSELLRGGRWDGILSLRHRDGHSVQVETRASLLVDGDGRPFVLASMVETSRLRTLEHDLAALDSLFDSSPLGVAIFDRELRYVRVNEALAAMNGRPVADHLGRTVFEVLDPEVAAELTELQRVVLATGRPVIDLVALAPNKRGHRSLSYHRLVDRAGQVLGISATVMDVTERVLAANKAERARRRLALLNDVGSRIAGELDVRKAAETIAEALVPTFGDYSGVVLQAEVADGGELPTAPFREDTPMRQIGVGAVNWTPVTERMLRRGQPIVFTQRSVFGAVLAGGEPRLISSEEELIATTYPGDPKVAAALELGISSLLVLPLRARGVVLGLLVVGRARGREPFDQEDLALGMDLADRSGAALDNARLYVREREGALILQRSLLPQTLPEPPGVSIAFRYVPASSSAEVGGDWFDVIPLAGGRLALVVGDVMGHGLGAAATMGRLRTAVRTLAGLDMPPDELLRRVNDLGDDLAQNQTEGWMATAVYAVYDPSTRRCAIAQAGHLPPVLVENGNDPDRCEARLLDLPPGVPLGVGGAPFETTELDVPDGAVLVLYTDGLVESRGKDIGTGMDRLRSMLCRPLDSLEDVCDEVLAGMEPGREPDDVALLVARLGGLPDGSTAAWTFPAEPSAVRLARRRVRDTLGAWSLAPLSDVTALLVSELVTNSLRYAHGPIGVRMVRGTSLLVEVSDPLPDPPRERVAADDDEGGRGLQLVGRASRRWGTRHGPLGKTVWFELALP